MAALTDRKTPIRAVPTNVITGFLGAGKTTAILHLLEQKHAAERWAVLVNEFGEIGVDGSIVQGRNSEERGVHIREVPGGCMCCTAGLPMQIALSQLLGRARPHRLLIEPSGLGHPLEVLQTLSSRHNRELLSLQKTLTLVDARNFSDERYTSHETFRQQLAIADLVVANKSDLGTEADGLRLQAYVNDFCRRGVDILHTEHGRVDLQQLSGSTELTVEGKEFRKQQHQSLLAGDLPIPECGYVTAVNEGEGFESIGWRFAPSKVFLRARLFSFLSGLAVERMKAVFITEDGIFGYNLTRDALTEMELDECSESRIEIVSDHIDTAWLEQLTACLEQGSQDGAE